MNFAYFVLIVIKYLLNILSKMFSCSHQKYFENIKTYQMLCGMFLLIENSHLLP